MSNDISNINKIADEFYNSIGEGISKTAFIRKIKNKYRVVSRKGKNLGTYNTRAEAVKRLRQIEFFKHKKASKQEDKSYSSIMRDLVKDKDQEKIDLFQKTFKKEFDQAYIDGDEEPENIALKTAIKVINASDNNYNDLLFKAASTVDLGDPTSAGRYLADVIKFVMRRISEDKRQKSINGLKKKIYYLNEYDMAAKKTPPGAAIGTCITLLKHLLLKQPPSYIRAILNSIVRSL